MALDRQSIEKKDFPVGRRGYDPSAVDAHLSAIADEVADLKRDARKRTDTLASTASEQVRAIVEAAEASAEQITSDAEADAREIRAEAASEAQATKDGALTQSREHIGRVSESTSSMLKRLDAMETELGSLIESLRTGSNRLGADLELLHGEVGNISDVFSHRGFEADEADEGESSTVVREAWGAEADEAAEAGQTVEEPAEAADAAEETADETAEEPALEAAEEPAYEETAAESVYEETAAEPVAEAAEEEPAEALANGDDTEGARLIALNMALNGTPREETEKYLSENFQLSDTSVLLDEVYASVEG